MRDFVTVKDNRLQFGTQSFPFREIERIVVVGFGKASGALAAGFEDALGEHLEGPPSVLGRVNVPDDQVVPTRKIRVVGCRPPGENLPTDEVVAGTGEILDLVRSASQNDICVCLISGGGSALLEQPEPPLTLAQIRDATAFLSRSGANIYELNAVRRVISQVKGGGLARACGGAPIVSLILSDVIGDQLEVIASGPTVNDHAAFCAMDVLKKFDPSRSQLPAEIWSVVKFKSSEILYDVHDPEITNLIIGNIDLAIQAARDKAVELGYSIESTSVSGSEGEAGEIGKRIAAQVVDAREESGSRCFLAGGETTVKLCDHPGRGGRNQHLVLSFIQAMSAKMAGQVGEFALLSGATDGEDGNVSVAGAAVEATKIRQIVEAGEEAAREIADSLVGCDSHRFLSRYNLLVRMPRTFTNVCDLRVLLTQNP